jgi:TetR/AcrR family transcriptional regulator, transcriptional repressor for nem operon
MARYAPGHKKEARTRILAAAGRGFRKRGYGGIGVDGLAKEAEVTSGAFYGHFPSKEAAFKDVVVLGLDELLVGINTLQVELGPKWIETFIDFYLGQRRMCDLGESCALQSLASDVQRADGEIKAVFETQLSAIAYAVAKGLTGATAAERLERAWSFLSILSGGVTLARAVQSQSVANAIAVAIRKTALDVCGK